MPTYKIPVVWQMYGHHKIEANSLQEAIEIAAQEGTPDGNYVDDSWELDHSDVVDSINGGLSEEDKIDLANYNEDN